MQPAQNGGHPRRWVILGVLVISLLVVVLDNTVLNVALKVIADPRAGLGATQSQLEWSINSYTLVFAGLLFTFGVLGDRLGRKRALLAGMAVFGIASLASAYAQTPTQLIGARALMGIGAAAVMPATLSILSNVFDPKERARAIGIWSGAVGLAIAVGPLLAGELLEHFWWGSVFLINVPVVIGAVIAVLVLVPESRNPQPGRIDLPGVLLSIAGLVALVYGIVSGGDSGDWGQPKVWGSIIVGVVVLAAFVLWERRTSHPSLDVRLFRDARFSAAVAATGLMFFAAMGTFFFSTFYLQNVRGYSPLESGALLVPFAVAQLAFAPRSSALVRRFGAKVVVAAGLVITAASLAGFTLLGEHTPIWVAGVLFFAQGVGMANVAAPATEAIMSVLPREKAGVGSAVGNTIRQVGGALGVAVLGSVLSQVYRGQIDPHLTHLPAGVQGAADESISATYAVAERFGLRQLIGPANDAFVHAMHAAAVGSAIVALLGAVVVAVWLPGRRQNGQHERGAVLQQTVQEIEVPAVVEGSTPVEVGIPAQRSDSHLAETETAQ